MIDNKTVCIIPARGGSKRLPQKNILPLKNEPLINYTIKPALNIFPAKNVILSTDSSKIAEAARSLGLEVPYQRPKYLGLDDTTTDAVVKDVLTWIQDKLFNIEYVLILQPTSPLRTEKHIRSALDIFKKNYNILISVHRNSNYDNQLYVESDKLGLIKVSRENNEKNKLTYAYNGAIYLTRLQTIISTSLHDIKPIQKFEMSVNSSIDIDTQKDLDTAKTLL